MELWKTRSYPLICCAVLPSSWPIVHAELPRFSYAPQLRAVSASWLCPLVSIFHSDSRDFPKRSELHSTDPLPFVLGLVEFSTVGLSHSNSASVPLVRHCNSVHKADAVCRIKQNGRLTADQLTISSKQQQRRSFLGPGVPIVCMDFRRHGDLLKLSQS